MFITHVNPHDPVIACTCLSALQSAASAFYPKLATGQTAAQWGRTLTTSTTQQRSEHTNHSIGHGSRWRKNFFWTLWQTDSKVTRTIIYIIYKKNTQNTLLFNGLTIKVSIGDVNYYWMTNIWEFIATWLYNVMFCSILVSFSCFNTQ